MNIIRSRNVNEAYQIGMMYIAADAVPQASRYGDTLEMPEPVTTIYARPEERVLFDEKRDCNPFFHLFEALWMLAGRNDVEFVSHYASRMKEFSDDGVTFHGAYGFRWRNHFDMEGGGATGLPDQLTTVIDILRHDPNSRRAVLTMWDPVADLGQAGKDFPCNTHIYFKIRENSLHMTVCNRSNDMIWGAYGANAVHMSVLQEYVARKLGLEVGQYRQMSDSFHVYTEVYEKHRPKVDGNITPCPYETGEVRPMPLFKRGEEVAFDADLERFLKEYRSPQTMFFGSSFFMFVVEPMRHAWECHRQKDYEGALTWISRCQALDWEKACREWLLRRKEKYDAQSL